MGQAKRRKTLDPNYGKVENPKYLRKITYKESDQEYLADLIYKASMKNLIRNGSLTFEDAAGSEFNPQEVSEIVKWASYRYPRFTKEEVKKREEI